MVRRRGIVGHLKTSEPVRSSGATPGPRFPDARSSYQRARRQDLSLRGTPWRYKTCIRHQCKIATLFCSPRGCGWRRRKPSDMRIEPNAHADAMTEKRLEPDEGQVLDSAALFDQPRMRESGKPRGKCRNQIGRFSPKAPTPFTESTITTHQPPPESSRGLDCTRSDAAGRDIMAQRRGGSASSTRGSAAGSSGRSRETRGLGTPARGARRVALAGRHCADARTKSPARAAAGRSGLMYTRRRGDDGIDFPFPPVPDDARPTPPRMTATPTVFPARGSRPGDAALRADLARKTPHAEANSSLGVPSLPA